MSLPNPSRSPQAPDLRTLLEAVASARSQLETARATPSGRHTSAASAQRDLLAALEQYAEALRKIGRPVPYRLRDELHLYRRLDLRG
jgi:hypothetical protein